MNKWLIVLFLAVIVYSLVMVQRVVTRTILTDDPAARRTGAIFQEENAPAPENVVQKTASVEPPLTPAQESLTHRVAPVREAPIKDEILPE